MAILAQAWSKPVSLVSRAAEWISALGVDANVILYSFLKLVQIFSNSKILYQIQFLSKIHEISSVILLNLQSI
jgi:hypothetical protein